MIRPLLDWFRGRKGETAGSSGAQTTLTGHDAATTTAAEFEPQVLIQGGLADLKRITQLLAMQSIDSQIIVPPSGCNT